MRVRTQHLELANAVGTVSSTMHQSGDVLLHVRFGTPLNLVVLNVAASQFEDADHLEPRLRLV